MRGTGGRWYFLRLIASSSTWISRSLFAIETEESDFAGSSLFVASSSFSISTLGFPVVSIKTSRLSA